MAQMSIFKKDKKEVAHDFEATHHHYKYVNFLNWLDWKFCLMTEKNWQLFKMKLNFKLA